MNTIKHTLRKLGRPVAALTLVLGTAGAVVAPVASVSAQAPSSDITRAVAALRGITTLRANFVQTDRSGQSTSGVLTLKRPGKIRFQYQKGVPLLIVGDGKALTMIDYEVRQVQRWPIGNSPLGALLDPSKDLSKFGKVVSTGDPTILSIEARDPKHPEYGTITMIFKRDAASPAGLQLYGWVALDSQNNRTAVRLTNQRYGAAVADSTFRWTDPRPRGRAAGG